MTLTLLAISCIGIRAHTFAGFHGSCSRAAALILSLSLTVSKRPRRPSLAFVWPRTILGAQESPAAQSHPRQLAR